MSGSNPKTTKRTSQSTVKIAGHKINTRKLSSTALIAILACLIIGILVGGFSLYAITKNDCFEMVTVGEQTDLEIGSEGNLDAYKEPGVKCVSFGKDVADSVTIKYLYREDMTHDTQDVDNITANLPGIYYVVYTSSNIKYKTVQLVRTVTVVRAED